MKMPLNGEGNRSVNRAYRAYSIGLFIAGLVYTVPLVQAACFTQYVGNYTQSSTCTIAADTLESVDGAQNNEASTTNNATLTVSAGITITSGASGTTRLVAGTISIASGGSLAIGNSAVNILPGAGIWVVDGDADGWVPDFTLYTATAAGRRRLGLMRHNSSPFDCNDAAYSEANSCYSYSQGTYYGYSQGYYYSYSQGYYYGYSQGTYYGYSQSWYGVCFPAGTKILMADGSTKEIQDISSGDEVLSYDLDQKRTVKDKVSKLLVHANAPGGYLIFNGELKVTGNHNMWVENKGIWLHADKLMVGDVLLNSKGEKVPVASIEKVDGVNTVYNLGLPGENHNYFTEDILVHNWKG